jgi:hypothetical protein
MSDQPPPGVLGGLPRTRPHRRSQKRPARSPDVDGAGATPRAAKPPSSKPRAAKPRAAKPPSSKPRAAKPRAAKPPSSKPRAAKPQSAHTRAQAKPRPSRPTQVRVAKPPAAMPPTSTAGPLETAVQAAAELAEIGLSVSARALRGALSRLPRR